MSRRDEDPAPGPRPRRHAGPQRRVRHATQQRRARLGDGAKAVALAHDLELVAALDEPRRGPPECGDAVGPDGRLGGEGGEVFSCRVEARDVEGAA